MYIFIYERMVMMLSPVPRCVYLAYLDSVNFFTPSGGRTNFYHELLLGYMAYIKERGYALTILFWICI